MTQRKLTTAEQKANKAVNTAKSQLKKDKKVLSHSKSKYSKYLKDKNMSLANKWKKKRNSTQRKVDRDTKKLKSAQKKASKVKNDTIHKKNLQTISNKIQTHNNLPDLEGHAAIYLSDGSSTDVIYISPTENESEDTSSNITTWARDKGAPASNYARVSSKTVSVSGIITGENRADSESKFYKLRVWHSRHYQVTYKGNIYYKHLLISDIQKSHNTSKIDNLDVSITFTFAYAAEITTESSKKNKKTSKSTKTVEGSRNKKYTAVTIKAGDTLWGYAQKYGKSVSWLRKVNNIKGSLIYPGKKIRVR